MDEAAELKTRGQFHETKLSVNSSEVEQNLLLGGEAMEEFLVNAQRKFCWEAFHSQLLSHEIDPEIESKILPSGNFSELKQKSPALFLLGVNSAQLQRNLSSTLPHEIDPKS